MREAVIVVILKLGKDPHRPESYRPITNRHENLDQNPSSSLKVILSLIHSDQTGFMPAKKKPTPLLLHILYMVLGRQQVNVPDLKDH